MSWSNVLRNKKIDCRGLVERLMQEDGFQEALAKHGRKRMVCAVQIGSLPPWQVQARKHAQAEVKKLGFAWDTKHMEPNATTNEVLSTIAALNADDKVAGVVIERPVPKHLSIKLLQQAVHPFKDIEGMHPASIGKVVYASGSSNTETLLWPCTAKASVEVLRQGLLQEGKGPELKGVEALVIGSSDVLAKPIGSILHREGATVTVCPPWVSNFAAYTRSADVVFSSANLGRPILSGVMLKPGSILIDLGMNIMKNDDGDDASYHLQGDSDMESCIPVVSRFSSLLHGVSLVRSAILCKNVITAQNLV